MVFVSSKPRPNYWLVSEQIDIKEAKEIGITINYLISSCSTQYKNGGHYCVNVFDLYVNQSNQTFPVPSNTAAYEKVTEIGLHPSGRTFKTINVPIKGKYVFLAFHNYGACCSLHYVKVTYNVCPHQTLDKRLISLPRTVSPASDSQAISVEGHCSRDTVKVPGSLYSQCQSTGEWNTSGIEGGCICKEDMHNVDGECHGMNIAL